MNAVLATDVGAPSATVFRDIPLSEIRPSLTDAQKHRRAAFSKPALEELAESIRQNGIAQAIVVRPIVVEEDEPRSSGGKLSQVAYEIVAGERRFIAAAMAGLERIPATIRELDDEQAVKLQLIENLQREDLHPMHEAEAYEELMAVHHYTVDEIWPDVGKSRAYVYGRRKLLALSPSCRKAFYAAEISTSIAEKIARIPTHAVQDEALEDVLGQPNAKESWRRRDPLSFREAAAHINEHYMLDLRTASFPTKDEKLNGVGPCTTCPKRSGNAPELFPDVKKGDTCTDTECFAAKTRAYGQRQLEQAKKDGAHTITGAAAKKIAPKGVQNSYDVKEGYHLADVETWLGSKRTTPRKLLKPEEATALLQDPVSGRVVEVIHDSQIKKPKSSSSEQPAWQKERKEQDAHAKTETAVRRAVFTALVAKGEWAAPPLRELVDQIVESSDYDGLEALMDLLGVVEGKKGGHYDRVEHHVKSLKTDEQLQAFLAQAYLAAELHVNSYSVSKKIPRLDAAAKAAGVDIAKIRRELAPKKPDKQTKPKSGVKVKRKAKK